MLIKPTPASANLATNMIFGELDALVPFARLTAQRGIFDGRMNRRNQALIDACRHQLRIKTGLCCSIIYTRETGYHSGGWWKNPDYERCLHLSIAFVEERPFGRLPFQKKEALRIATAFFGDDVRLTWFEPAYSERGKECDVGHYRLFCDPGWNPMKPRGEIYNTDWTPASWKSFSDLHGEE